MYNEVEQRLPLANSKIGNGWKLQDLEAYGLFEVSGSSYYSAGKFQFV